MGDQIDFLRKRRQQMADNPSMSARALNNVFCETKGIPTFHRKGVGIIKDGEFNSQEQQRQIEQDRMQQNALMHKINTCGESKIGRSASSGKFGTIMEADDQDIGPIPEFKSVAEQARYMHKKNIEKRAKEETDNKVLNMALGSHILNHLVDQESIGGVAIREASSSSELKDITDTKTDLRRGHLRMYNDPDYRFVAGIKKMRVFDESDEQELSRQHEVALSQHLQSQVSVLESQELPRD
jgi:hypothetical protein